MSQALDIASNWDRDPDLECNGLYFTPGRAARTAANVCGCEILVFDDIGDVADLWRTFQKSAAMTSFQRYEWLSCWYETSASIKKIKPRIIVVLEKGYVRLIAPLAIENDFLTKRLVWLGYENNDYNAPLVDGAWLAGLDPVEAADLWRHITTRLEPVDYVHLIRHPTFLGEHRNPFIGAKPVDDSCNAHFLKLHSHWPAFYHEIRGKKSRQRLREKINRLKKSGDLKFRRIRGHKETRRAIQSILEQKKNQLEQIGARNSLKNGQLQKHLLALAGDENARDLLRVYVLEVDKKSVASVIALVHGGSLNLFISVYDYAQYRNCSPGTILLVKLIELAVRANLSEIDFSVGDEPYKYYWCDGQTEITCQIESLTATGAPCAALARMILGIKRRLKSSRFATRTLQFINARIISFTRYLSMKYKS